MKPAELASLKIPIFVSLLLRFDFYEDTYCDWCSCSSLMISNSCSLTTFRFLLEIYPTKLLTLPLKRFADCKEPEFWLEQLTPNKVLIAVLCS